MDYYEYEESPVVRKWKVTIAEITVTDIKQLDNAEIWNSPDRYIPSRPLFYCLEIRR